MTTAAVPAERTSCVRVRVRLRAYLGVQKILGTGTGVAAFRRTACTAAPQPEFKAIR